MYQSTKKYGHDIGISCAFRQHKAHSHCKFIHGYALSFKFVFETEKLDHRDWVIDFGGLKSLKAEIEKEFDHKLLVAKDDPFIEELCVLSGISVADVRVVDNIGCESFAHRGFELAREWMHKNSITHVKVVSCECAEHGANSAIYLGEKNV